MAIIVGEIYELAKHSQKKVIVLSSDEDGIVVQLLDHVGSPEPGSKIDLSRGDIVRLSLDELVLREELVGDNEDMVKYLRRFDEVM